MPGGAWVPWSCLRFTSEPLPIRAVAVTHWGVLFSLPGLHKVLPPRVCLVCTPRTILPTHIHHGWQWSGEQWAWNLTLQQPAVFPRTNLFLSPGLSFPICKIRGKLYARLRPVRLSTFMNSCIFKNHFSFWKLKKTTGKLKGYYSEYLYTLHLVLPITFYC